MRDMNENLRNIRTILADIRENTKKKIEHTLEFEMNTNTKQFWFDPVLQLDDSFYIGLTQLSFYNSIYNITDDNNNNHGIT